MSEKFCLSDKMGHWHYDSFCTCIEDGFTPQDLLKVEDVKEFIRLLKEELDFHFDHRIEEGDQIRKFIDDLLGEDLR